MAKISNTPVWVGLALLALLAAYLYAIHAILSPILIGLILIFVLAGIDDPFARRIYTAEWTDSEYFFPVPPHNSQPLPLHLLQSHRV